MHIFQLLTEDGIENLLEGVEVYKKKIGVIGLGKMSTEVCKRCMALGMEVMGYDPYIAFEEKAEKLGISFTI